ncbi:MAG: sensor domain-containing diguanylate cyclase [Anaerolineales bacterium]|nr:sensor domain-containing diguanylate cyclase [Anaerolineales bacterium]
MPTQRAVRKAHLDLFDLAPISLWEDDYSGVKARLDSLRARGVADLPAYLTAHPELVTECMARIRVLRVNRRTLELFGAASQAELLANLGRVFRDEMAAKFPAELAAMWAGAPTFAGEGVNYTLAGRPLDIHLRWSVLPGHEGDYARALVSIEDVTAQKQAERALAASELRFRGLFEHAPISLWEEDYTAVKRRLDQFRAAGVDDLRRFLGDHPQIVRELMAGIRVLDVNARTVALYRAGSKADLLRNLGQVFRDDMGRHFLDELVDMWDGNLKYEREGINYALDGEPLHIQLNWAVLPGAEATFERVLVAIQDITARKKAEDYLKYLGTHDVLTGLYNRAYFEEELARLERGRRYPVSVLVLDLNGLKATNDTRGHPEGDKLIRRAGESLLASVRADDVVARIGGDEFAVLLPATDAAAAQQAVERVRSLIELNNKYYRSPVLSMSAGVATALEPGHRLTDVLRMADDLMYVEKRRYHATHG